MIAPSPTVQLRPQAGPQTAFFETPADIAFYGGAAGGGKTWAMLAEPLRHLLSVKGFGAQYFRRTRPQIVTEGGVWDESKELYPHFGGVPREGSVLDWTFPPYNNRIKFDHLQHEKDLQNYQSAQIALIIFDELTQFRWRQFTYMFSRNRSTCGVRPYIRAGYNPVPAEDPVGGWIHKFVGWYLDDEGYPIPERSGVVRWFVMVDDEPQWYESKAAALKERPDSRPLSFAYIMSLVTDNEILLEKDPDYLAKLEALPHVDRERLLKGNHKIMPAAGNVFNRSWFNIVGAIPAGDAMEVLFWDFAATEKEQNKADPDFTAYNHMRRVGNYGAYSFCVVDAGADQLDPADTETYFLNISRQKAAQAKREGVLLVVAWEEEPGSASKRETARMIKALAGIVCGGIRSHKDKVVRATPLAVAAKAGNVSLLDAAWNKAWLTHMHNQPEWPHDDEMDAASGSFNALTDPEFLKNLVQRRGIIASGKTKGWQ